MSLLSGNTAYVADGADGLYVLRYSGAISIPENQTALPNRFTLHQNYPNPFNPTTTIAYELPQSGRITLTIYNALGQKVRTLVSRQQSAGLYKVVCDGRDELGIALASGVCCDRELWLQQVCFAKKIGKRDRNVLLFL